MSVPRKSRLPAWRHLTDEDGKYELTISVCSISFGRTGACSGRGARTAWSWSCRRWRRSHAPPPQPPQRSRTCLDWTSLIVSAASELLLALAAICVPGVGYALALASCDCNLDASEAARDRASSGSDAQF